MSTEKQAIIINEVQLILAEKRTTLSMMRTGIAILVLPLSVRSVLAATSKFYDAFHVLYLLIPLGVLCAALIGFSAYLIIRSFIKILHYDHLINEIKLKHSYLQKFMD